MLQKRLKPLAAFLCAFSVLCCTGCGYFTPNPEPITELNQTYEGSQLNITATTVDVVRDPFSETEISIGVRFVVENKSNNDVFFKSSGFSVYVDDVATKEISASAFNDPGTLYGNIAPGKRLEGYYAVLGSSSSKSIEIRIPTNNTTVTFILDVPTVS